MPTLEEILAKASQLPAVPDPTRSYVYVPSYGNTPVNSWVDTSSMPAGSAFNFGGGAQLNKDMAQAGIQQWIPPEVAAAQAAQAKKNGAVAAQLGASASKNIGNVETDLAQRGALNSTFGQNTLKQMNTAARTGQNNYLANANDPFAQNKPGGSFMSGLDSLMGQYILGGFGSNDTDFSSLFGRQANRGSFGGLEPSMNNSPLSGGF